MIENKFRDSQLIPWLKSIDGLKYFIKEALAIRAIPDIIGCYKSKFFALEVKKSKAEASRKTGRIVQQRYWLATWAEEANAFTSFVYPENLEEVKEKLLNLQ